MKNYKGGKTPLLSWYRTSVAVLVGSCFLVAYMAWNTPASASILQQFASTSTGISCKKAPEKLQGVALSAYKPGLHTAKSDDFYYAVTGNSPAEINRSMASCSPAAHGHGDFAADTAYVINWRFDPSVQQLGTCTLKNVAVGVITRHTYPQWDGSNAPAPLRAKWNNFMANLTVHEQYHAQLDRQYADRVLRTLQAVPPADCAVVTEQAHAAARAIITQLDAAHAAYDADTSHGRTQGAVLR